MQSLANILNLTNFLEICHFKFIQTKNLLCFARSKIKTDIWYYLRIFFLPFSSEEITIFIEFHPIITNIYTNLMKICFVLLRFALNWVTLNKKSTICKNLIFFIIRLDICPDLPGPCWQIWELLENLPSLCGHIKALPSFEIFMRP